MLKIIWRWLYRIFVCAMMPLAFVSAVSDLKVVIDAVAWLYDQLTSLQFSIRAIGNLIETAVLAWRSFTAPVRDWIYSLFPIGIDAFWFDLVALVMIPAPRYIVALRASSSSAEAERNLLAEFEEHNRYVAAVVAGEDPPPNGLPTQQSAVDRWDETNKARWRTLDAFIEAKRFWYASLVLAGAGLLLLTLDWLIRHMA